MENVFWAESTLIMNPMEMEEILKVLFEVMKDVSSLKSSRQVSTLWNREATRATFKKGFFRLPLNFHDNYTKEQKKEQVEFIRHFLETRQLTIEKIRIFDDRDVDIFHSISPEFLGDSVKSLKLCYGSADTHKKLIQSLNNLKSLDHESKYPFVAFSRDTYATLISFQKPLTLSHFEFSPVDRFHSKETVDENLEIYEKFLHEKMTARSIQTQLHEALDFNHKSNYVYTDSKISLERQEKRERERLQVLSQVTASLSKILQASQNTLETFVMWDPLGLLPDLKMPQLPQVKSLIVRIRFCDNKSSAKDGIIRKLLNDGLLFPPGFKFMDVFPNLEVVQLSAFSVMKGEMKLMQLWALSLSSAGKAEKVKTLVVEDDEIGTTRKSLQAIFPNME